MKIIITYDVYQIELSYNEDGLFECAKNIHTNEFLMCYIISKGKRYTIEDFNSIIGGISKICEAQYVYLKEIDIFIPYYIYIINKK